MPGLFPGILFEKALWRIVIAGTNPAITAAGTEGEF
jgi:hypothetical protein